MLYDVSKWGDFSSKEIPNMKYTEKINNASFEYLIVE